MDEFEAHNAKAKVVVLILAALAFVVLGMWLVGAFGAAPLVRRIGPFDGASVGWVSIAFFGLCLIAWVKRLFDNEAQVRIGPTGIQAAQWSDDRIPWSEITEVTTWSYRQQTMIILHLRNPDLFPGRGAAAMVARLNRGMTGGDIAIALTGTDRSPEEALAAIATFQP